MPNADQYQNSGINPKYLSIPDASGLQSHGSLGFTSFTVEV